MGCFFSASRRQVVCLEDPFTLASETVFSINDVEALFELSRAISGSVVDDGLISKEEFQLAIFNSMDKENLFASREKGLIDFGDFVRALSVFHPESPQQVKIDFSFRLYDLDNTNFIERDEVKHMIMALLSECQMKLTDETIEAILNKL